MPGVGVLFYQNQLPRNCCDVVFNMRLHYYTFWFPINKLITSPSFIYTKSQLRYHYIITRLSSRGSLLHIICKIWLKNLKQEIAWKQKWLHTNVGWSEWPVIKLKSHGSIISLLYLITSVRTPAEESQWRNGTCRCFLHPIALAQVVHFKDLRLIKTALANFQSHWKSIFLFGIKSIECPKNASIRRQVLIPSGQLFQTGFSIPVIKVRISYA